MGNIDFGMLGYVLVVAIAFITGYCSQPVKKPNVIREIVVDSDTKIIEGMRYEKIMGTVRNVTLDSLAVEQYKFQGIYRKAKNIIEK